MKTSMKYPMMAMVKISKPQIMEVNKKLFFLLNLSTKVPAYKPKNMIKKVSAA